MSFARHLADQVESLKGQVARLQEEIAGYKDQLSRKYDVMSWAADEGGLTLMKQDGAMIHFDVSAKDGTPSGPPSSSRVIPDQRCLLIPAKDWEKVQAVVDAAKVWRSFRSDDVENRLIEAVDTLG